MSYIGEWNNIMAKYNIKTWEDEYNMQASFLDKIDMKPYIEKYEDLDDIWDAIENDYDNTELSNNELLAGFILNWFDHYDLQKYIKNKYNVDYKEYTTTSYIRD